MTDKKPLFPQKYVFFDLDGTLTDPAEGIVNCAEYALKKFGLTADREYLKRFIGPPLHKTFMHEFGFPEEKATLAIDYYRERFKDIGIFENELYSGIPELLRDLQASGRSVVLATSKPEVYAERILDHFGIADCFTLAVGSLLNNTRDAKSEVIAFALEKLGASPTEVIMVGDRRYDVEGAAANGIKTVGVLYGYGSREELMSAGAVAVCETVKELGEALLA